MRLARLLFSAWCGAAAAHADVVVLPADRDASIFQNNQSNSNGGGPVFFAGTNNAGMSPRRGLISFDLGSLPPGAIVTDVQLTLTVGQAAGNPTTIGLHELTSNWGEGTTGHDAPMVDMTGQGFPAEAGDVTWGAAFYSPTAPVPWTTPGGDFDPTASATLTLNDTTIGDVYTWLSTSALLGDVQEWLTHPDRNFGWELKGTNEALVKTVFGFYSSEWHTFPGGDAALEPRLQVTFTIPEPAPGALAGSALLLGAGRRRRPRVAS